MNPGFSDGGVGTPGLQPITLEIFSRQLHKIEQKLDPHLDTSVEKMQ